MFGRKKPIEKQEPQTTPQALKSDAKRSSSGVGNILKGAGQVIGGAGGSVWHSYASVFNPKARNIIGTSVLVCIGAYSAAQEEMGAPSLGDIYKAAKNGTCWAIPESIEPAYCQKSDELSAIDSAIHEALTKG